MNLPDGRLLTYEVREVVAYFADVTGFESAVEALERHGIRRAHINMMGSHDAVKEKLGHHFLGGMEVDAESSAPQAIFSDKRETRHGKSLAIGLPVYIGGAAAASMDRAGGKIFG